MIEKTKYIGVYRKKKKIFTKNLVPGFKVYGEELVKVGREEYRNWNPRRSKLGAAILKGLKELPIKNNDSVLYLGAASGTTASHVSDIVENGVVYCIDFAPRVVRDLLFVCSKRKNMFPLLADAGKPEKYFNLVPKCDFIYQDIAQRKQVQIFVENFNMFIKKGYGFFAVKSRSIDVTKNPNEIFNEVEKELKKEFIIIDKIKLEPFEKDHCIFLVKK